MAYLALSTANLPNPTIDPAQDIEPRDYFETFIYTGNGAGLQVGDVIKKPADTTTISSSLIFNQPDTHYLSRTPSASTETNSATTFTVSCWFKPTYNSTDFQNIWMAGNSGQVDRTFLRYNSAQDDSKLVVQNDGGFSLTTAQVLRDTSRWYHIVVAVDTRSSVTQADRVKVWVDGVLQTLSGTQAGADETTRWNQNKLHYIGNSTYTSGRNLDGYLAEFHNIDGIAYDHEDFGNFDANGIWIPKAVTGLTYGDNGFHLNFSDNTNTTTLGEDQTANGNDWTLNNFVVGDQVADSPTDNFATFDRSLGSSTFSEGNLRVSVPAINESSVSNIRILRGKFYAEFTMVTESPSGFSCIGVCNDDYVVNANSPGNDTAGNSTGYISDGSSGGKLRVGGSTSTLFGDSYTTGNIISIAVDKDNDKWWIAKNGVWQASGDPANGTNSASENASGISIANTGVRFVVGNSAGSGASVWEANFGQKTFTYTPPTGFLALSENNITVDDQNLESPDLVWCKNRNGTQVHQLYDTVRGIQKALRSNDTNAEQDVPNGLIDFNTNGFTLGSDGNPNGSGNTYVSWCWKLGGSPTVDNSAGTSAVPTAGSVKVDGSNYASALTGTLDVIRASANTTSGCSIIKYQGDDAASGTVNHFLSSAPEFVIVKNLEETISNPAWPVYHKYAASDAHTDYLDFSTNGAIADAATVWNDTAPSSTLVTVGTADSVNSGSKHIMYCFHSVDGFSKFGSYQGNNLGGNDGPFVYLGFQPALVILRFTGLSNGWFMFDNAREPNNHKDQFIMADMDAFTNEYTQAARGIDFVSNGFKLRTDAAYDPNASGTYIYMAWAESPFKFSTAR